LAKLSENCIDNIGPGKRVAVFPVELGLQGNNNNPNNILKSTYICI
jgi:hypothetical protein